MPIVTRNIATGLLKTPPGGLKLALRNASPTIMVVGGCVGIIAGTVFACKATLKADAVLDEIEGELSKVEHVREITTEEKYSKQDYNQDKTIVLAKGGAKLLRLYLPAIVLIGGSIALILGGHKSLTNRYVMSVAAGEAANSALQRYRERVREDLGEAADRKYAYGVKEEVVGTIEEVDEKGKSHKKKIKGDVVDKSVSLASPYAAYWDNTCLGWSPDVYYNEAFLINKQKEWNRKLAQSYQINGFVTLAEVKKDLGIFVNPRDINLGWIYSPGYDPAEHGMRDQIDFGIFSPRNSEAINGSEPVYVLDFNVQGDLARRIPSRLA